MSVERREKNGRVFYVAVPYRNGKRQKSKSFPTRKEAVAYERTYLGGRKEPTTVAEWVDVWLSEPAYQIVKTGPTRGRPKKQKTLDKYRTDLAPLIDRIGDVRLVDVDRRHARNIAAEFPLAAVVARNCFADAYDSQLIPGNPFTNLGMKQQAGRSNDSPLSVDELNRLVATSRAVHGPDYGPVAAAHILFSAYTGIREDESYHLEWRDVHPDEEQVFIRVAKLDKPEFVYMLPEAWAAIKDLPRYEHVDPDGRLTSYVFTNKRDKNPLNKSSHYPLWRDPFNTFFYGLPEERRTEIRKLDWHSLRHFCGHHFYITLGYGEELAARQLRHADPALIRKRYGHFEEGAMERLRQMGGRPVVRELRRRSA